MPRTSAYQARIRTDSGDNQAILLFDDGALVAILVELADVSHGDRRGEWIVESVFGLYQARSRTSFPSASDAAGWVTDNINHRAFVLDRPLDRIC